MLFEEEIATSDQNYTPSQLITVIKKGVAEGWIPRNKAQATFDMLVTEYPSEEIIVATLEEFLLKHKKHH